MKLVKLIVVTHSSSGFKFSLGFTGTHCDTVISYTEEDYAWWSFVCFTANKQIGWEIYVNMIPTVSELVLFISAFLFLFLWNYFTFSLTNGSAKTSSVSHLTHLY